MRRPQEIADEQQAMSTIVSLTGAFEGLASMKIARIKNQVMQSKAFFDELWQIYSQLRVDTLFRYGREESDSVVKKNLVIAITAEGGFSGDIDQKLIQWLLKEHDPSKQDIIIIGHHGAVQLTQASVSFKKYYKLPDQDQNINVAPLIRHVRGYTATTVYYQTYVSLMVQDIKRIELSKAVLEAGLQTAAKSEVISDDTYIFEPSSFAVIAHLEKIMVDITLSQVILDSKLAQYASRFRAMNVANDRADESFKELGVLYNRTKRTIADERLKEILNSRRKERVT